MLKWTLTVFLLAAFVVSCATSQTEKNWNRGPDATDEDPWTTWSNDDKNAVQALLVLRKIRNDLLDNNLHDPHVDYSVYKRTPKCPTDLRYRTADGTCYIDDKPLVGASGVAFGRNVSPDFIDKHAMETIKDPNPKDVSKVFFTRDTKGEGDYKKVPFLNMLAASWIQFMNHDWLTHGRNEEKGRIKVSDSEDGSGIVDRTKKNPVSVSKYKDGYSVVTINEVTHWWDGSQIYGSNMAEQKKLRTFSDGRMKMAANGRLPDRPDLDVANNVQNQGKELTGFMDNWWVGLSMLHTLFVKEHNAIAAHLRQSYVKGKSDNGKWIWTGNPPQGWKASRADRKVPGVHIEMTDAELDEHIFQVARLINAAVMAKIHTIEWTPAILANDILRVGMFTNWYGLANKATRDSYFDGEFSDRSAVIFRKIDCGYTFCGIVGDKTDDYGVPYSITEEFTSVYRLHSLLPENLELRKFEAEDIEKVDFLKTRNEMSRQIMDNYELKDMFYSFGRQLPGQLVLNNFPNFMQSLPIPKRGNMDLGMVDVLRDRERGVPRYNKFRRALGLKQINCYHDFFLNGEGWLKSVDKCDRDSYAKALAEHGVDESEIARRKEVLEKFDSVYGKDDLGVDNVEAIDLLVGTLSEEVRPMNFGFGETMFQIFILMASRRLMADPFFTTKYSAEYYTAEGIKWIDYKSRFADVLIRHMPEVASKVEGLSTAFAPWNK